MIEAIKQWIKKHRPLTMSEAYDRLELEILRDTGTMAEQAWAGEQLQKMGEGNDR